MPKHSVLLARITTSGAEGDRQKHTAVHGGPERAVTLYSLDLIDAFRREGHPIAVGSLGENLTISGVDWSRVVPGARVTVGDVELEITMYASPCGHMRQFFLDHDSMRISQDRHPGWSRVCAKVLNGGILRPGDRVSVT
jgi:MOSC domain-containing protein YiiM